MSSLGVNPKLVIQGNVRLAFIARFGIKSHSFMLDSMIIRMCAIQCKCCYSMSSLVVNPTLCIPSDDTIVFSLYYICM